MSTILEAIKKSEQERKLKDIPTLSDMPAPQERRQWPIYMLILLVVVLIGVLVWFLLSDRLNSRLQVSAVPVSKNVSNNDASTVVENGEEVEVAQTDSSSIVVNVVSFSTEPLQRFVIVNGKMFREGDFVRTGVKVEEIREKSVLLNERGKEVVREP